MFPGQPQQPQQFQQPWFAQTNHQIVSSGLPVYQVAAVPLGPVGGIPSQPLHAAPRPGWGSNPPPVLIQPEGQPYQIPNPQSDPTGLHPDDQDQLASSSDGSSRSSGSEASGSDDEQPPAQAQAHWQWSQQAHQERPRRPKRKRWKSPYDFFLQDYKSQSRDLGQAGDQGKELRRAARERWETMEEPEKAGYQQRALEHRQLTQPDQPEPAAPQEQGPKQPAKRVRKRGRRTKSSYDLFLGDYKKRYRKEHNMPSFDDKQARKAAREAWDAMSDPDREPYEALAAKMRAELRKNAPSSAANQPALGPYELFRQDLKERLGGQLSAEHDGDKLERLIQQQWEAQTASGKQVYVKKAEEAERAQAAEKLKRRSRPTEGVMNAGASNIGGMIYCYRKTGQLPQTTKLTYLMMVKIAIYLLEEPQGSSFPAISKFISSHYTVNEKTFRASMSQAIGKLKEAGALEKRKASYKFTPTELEQINKSIAKAEDPDGTGLVSETATKKRRMEEAKKALEEAKRHREAQKKQEEEKRRYPIDDCELLREYAAMGVVPPPCKRPAGSPTVEWIGELLMLVQVGHVIEVIDPKIVQLAPDQWVPGLCGTCEEAADRICQLHMQLLLLLLGPEYDELVTRCSWPDVLCRQLGAWLESCGCALHGVLTHLPAAHQQLEQGNSHRGMALIHKLALVRWLCDQVVGTERAHDAIDAAIEAGRKEKHERIQNEQESRRKEREQKEQYKKAMEGMTREAEEERARLQQLEEQRKRDAMVRARLERAERGRNPHFLLTENAKAKADGHEGSETADQIEPAPENGDTPESKPKLNSSPELDAAEQSKPKTLEQIARLVRRIEPLGKDRDFNRYWFFGELAAGSLLVESADGSSWVFLKYKYELDRLMRSLDDKGVREKGLLVSLYGIYDQLTAVMPKGVDPEPEELRTETVETQWVQCEKCSKWRKVASDIIFSSDVKWCCQMNTWDPKHASCSDPEEKEEEHEELIAFKEDPLAKPEQSIQAEPNAESGAAAEALSAQAAPAVQAVLVKPEPVTLDRPAGTTGEAPVAEQLVKPEAPAQQVPDPAAEPAAEPSSEPSSEPAAEPAAEPASEPSSEPAAEQSSEPAAAAEQSSDLAQEPEPENLPSLLLKIDTLCPVDCKKALEMEQLRKHLVRLHDTMIGTQLRAPAGWYQEATRCQDHMEASDLLASVEAAIMDSTDSLDAALPTELTLEMLGTSDVIDLSQGRREKRLLWQTAAERQCWIDNLTTAPGIARMGLVARVLGRRLDAFVARLKSLDARRPSRTEKQTRSGKRNVSEVMKESKGPSGPSAREKRRRGREQHVAANLTGAAPQRPPPLSFKRDGRIVWGKMKGMDWWPAQCCTIQGGVECKDGDQLIVFFSTDEYCFSQPDDIMAFDPSHDAVARMLPDKGSPTYDSLVLAVHAATAQTISASDSHTGVFLWAKLKGYPWWPGEVVAPTYALPEEPGQKLIIFFETREFAYVPDDSIKTFTLEDSEMLSKVGKNKQLQAAVQLATQAVEQQAIKDNAALSLN